MRQLLPWVVGIGIGVVIGLLIAPRAQAPRPVPPCVPPPAPEDIAPQESVELPPETEEASQAILRPPAQPAAPRARTTGKPRVANDGRVQILVEVRQPNGQLASEAEIRWGPLPRRPSNRTRRGRWKPNSRNVWVQPGRLWVHAIGGANGTMRSADVEIEVGAAQPLRTATLQLEAGVGIHGRVVLPGTFLRNDLAIHLHRMHPKEELDGVLFSRTDLQQRLRAGKDQGFSFVDLEPGRYAIGLVSRGGTVLLREEAVVEGDLVEQDLRLDAFDPRRFMEVRVLGPGGDPLHDVDVSTRVSTDTLSATGGGVSLQRDDGVFIVSHNPMAKQREDGTYEDGFYTLLVRSRDHGEISKRYDPNKTTSLTLRYEKRAPLLLRVSNMDAVPFPGKLLIAIRQQGESGISDPRPLNAEGEVDLGPRKPGRYDLALLVQPNYRLLCAHPIEIADGESVLNWALPEFHELEVRLPAGADDVGLRLTLADGRAKWGMDWLRTEADGVLRWSTLAEGTYDLTGHVGERYIQRKIHVPTEASVQLD